MSRTVSLIDSAIGTLKAARDDLRHDTDVLASDLSAVIGTTRELTWTIDTMLAVLVDRYGHQSYLGHDNGLDPTPVIARIVDRLAQTRRCLDQVDGMLTDAHNDAAKLHNTNH